MQPQNRRCPLPWTSSMDASLMVKTTQANDTLEKKDRNVYRVTDSLYDVRVDSS